MRGERRRWWHAQRYWLAGCAVLAPLALAWPAWDAWRDYRRWHPLHAIDVAAGSSAAFGGAEWRLGAVEILDPHTLALARALPEHALVLVAHFTMTPAAGADTHLLAACSGRLGDARGRRWDERPLELSGLRLSEPSGCVAGFGANASVQSTSTGTPWRFVQVYLIPEDAAANARPEIILPKLQPNFLRFARR